MGAPHRTQGPRPLRQLNSLLAEAAQPGQQSVDDALVAVPQLSLQHGGQGVLLQPHLRPRTEGQGSTQGHSIHHRAVGSYLLFLVCFFKKTFPLI